MQFGLNIGFLVSAAASLLFILFHLLFSSGKKDGAVARSFEVVLALGALEVAAEAVALFLFADASAYPVAALYAVTTFLTFMRCVLPFALMLYVLFLCAKYNHPGPFLIGLACLPFACAVAISLSNPWANVLFSIDSSGHQVHLGNFEFALMVYTLLYCAFSLGVAVVYRSVLRRHDFASVLEFSAVLAGFVVVECLFPDLLLAGFAISLCGLVLLLSTNSPFSVTDPLTGAYEPALFREDAQRLLRTGKSFEVVFAYMRFPQRLAQLSSSSIIDEGLVLAANAFFKAASGRHVYRLTPYLFASIVYSRRERLWVMDGLQQFFSARHQLDSATVLLEAQVGYVSPTLPPSSADELQSLIEFAADSLSRWGEGDRSLPAPTSQQMEESFNRQALVRRCIKEALDQDFFSVYLQPLWSLSAQRFVSAEALSRLIHPEVGSISPAEFIPVAEEEGYIGQIGRRQFRRLCAFVAQHRSQLEQMGIQSVKVNVSAVEIMDPEYPAFVAGTMAEMGVSPEFFQFEITETVATSMDESMSVFLREVSAGGSKLCMDDFGSGFANLSMICLLPFDVVKMDSSLLRGIGSDERASILYRDSLAMMEDLGMETVCEGAETEEEVALISQWRADVVQGFYFARPMSFEQLLEGSWLGK